MPAATPWKYAVLVVDDIPAVRQLVVHLLSRAGYRVFEAADGGEAVQVLEQHPGAIDLVLTDVRMPGTDGAQLGRIVHERWPRQRLLYMSGFTGAALKHFNLPQTPVPLLEKPFTPSELLARVAEALATPGGAGLPPRAQSV